MILDVKVIATHGLSLVLVFIFNTFVPFPNEVGMSNKGRWMGLYAQFIACSCVADIPVLSDEGILV
jgi:hypothetical protein